LTTAQEGGEVCSKYSFENYHLPVIVYTMPWSQEHPAMSGVYCKVSLDIYGAEVVGW